MIFLIYCWKERATTGGLPLQDAMVYCRGNPPVVALLAKSQKNHGSLLTHQKLQEPY